MKTLRDHRLLVDKECPLCRGYGAAFEAAGLLEKNSVMPYETGIDAFGNLDVERAKNEIALVNTADGSIIYGVDSLVKIVGHSSATIQRIASIAWVKMILLRAYRFVSLNRKVIVPSATSFCIPSYSFRYRILFILIANLLSSYVLYKYSFKLHDWISVSGYGRELCLSFGQLLFQSLFLIPGSSQRLFDYLGNLSMVSLMGSLLLVLVLVAGAIVPMAALVYAVCFGAVVGLIFLEHWRRIKILDMPAWLCLTWVAYRMMLLLLYI